MQTNHTKSFREYIKPINKEATYYIKEAIAALMVEDIEIRALVRDYLAEYIIRIENDNKK